MGFFEKLRNGLGKTRESISEKVNSVFSIFTKIDEEFFEELEEALIMADLGAETSTFIIGELESCVKKKGITDPEAVKDELKSGKYCLEADVDIGMMVDYKAIYKVGKGKLIHNCNGFILTGCDGKLNYTQSPLASYGLYADYYWYEIDDVICIGNKDALYYCFPQDNTPVAKARLAAEELYKLTRENRKKQKRIIKA